MKKYLSPEAFLVLIIYAFMILCLLIKEFGGF